MVEWYRAVLKNRANNYYFLCGGTLEELRVYLREEDSKRNDGKSCINVLDTMVGTLRRKRESDFVALTFDNKLEFMLLRASEPTPINEASPADIAMLLKTLITKENDKNDGE